MVKSLVLLTALLPAAAATPIQPGRWQTTVTIVDLTVPGAPPGVAASMRGHPTTVTACVTPAQAAAGPRGAVNEGNGRCRYTSYTMAGAHLDSTAVCARPGGTITMRSVGSYTPTSINLEGTSTATGRGAMSMRTRVVSRRVGGC